MTMLLDGKVASRSVAAPEERLFWLDLIRATAAVMVVLLHSGSPYLTRMGRVPESQWAIIHSVEALLQVSVPLFFMISGYLNLSKQRIVIQRLLLRAIIPLLFYSSIAIGYVYYVKEGDLLSTVRNVWSSKAFYHLWFFYTIIGIYISCYLLRPSKDNPEIRSLVAICMLILIGPGTGLIFKEFLLGSRLFVDGMFFGFLIYTFIGYYLGHSTLNFGIREKYRFCFWVFILGSSLVGTVSLSRWISLQEGRYDPIFFTYQSPLIVIQSVAFFILCKEFGHLLERAAWVRRSVTYIAKYSLGIYGFHAFIMDYLRFEGGFGLTSNNAVAHFIALFVITLLLSLGLSRIVALMDRKQWLV